MKRVYKKIFLLFVFFINFFYVKGFCNMTTEAKMKAIEFEENHPFLISVTSDVSRMLRLIIFVLAIVVPFIIFFKKIKKDNTQKDSLIMCECLFLLTLFISFVLQTINFSMNPKWLVINNIITIILSIVAVIIVVVKMLTKKDNSNNKVEEK